MSRLVVVSNRIAPPDNKTSAGGLAVGVLGALKAGVKLEGWGDDADGEPEKFGDYRNGVNPYEHAHGMRFPVNTYPLFETAIRGAKGRSVPFHQKKLGKLFQRFNAVGAANWRSARCA